MDDFFAGSGIHPSTSSLVSTAAVAAGLPMKPETTGGVPSGTISYNSESTRWQDKGRVSRGSRAEKDEIKKFKKMKIDKYDEFQEWVDGDATFRYRPKDLDARKHLSGWAMRNTNNHNKKVLKKSCLGVFLCTKNCHNNQGELVTVRPATSDRARRKQMEKSCPRPGCDGKLYHVACAGKNGYPVTHFWRVTDVVILFQSKGTHDHPRPDVVKTTSMAKMALLEYHRAHRHERPKEICRKVGVHLHKSFNRVDRVARQLREVQSGVPKDDKDPSSANYQNMGRSYTLRSHVRGLFTSPQKASEAEQYGAQVEPFNGRPHYGNYYPHQSHLETWSPYTTPHEFAYSHYAPADHLNALHASSYVGYAAASHPEFAAQYEHMKIDYASSCGSSYLPGLHEAAAYATDTSSIASNPLDLVVSRNGMTVASSAEPISLTTSMSNSYHNHDGSHLHSNTLLTPVVTSNMTVSSGATETTSIRVDTSLPAVAPYSTIDTSHLEPTPPPPTNPLKRPAPPELQPLIRDNKQSSLPAKVNELPTSSKKIKLKEHTPSINIDLTNFSDIFDIGAGLGDEGLAGRPKSPVYQNLSPVQEATMQNNVQYEKELQSETKAIGKKPAHAHHTQHGSDSFDSRKHFQPSEPLTSPISSLKTVVSKPHDSPVFAQLSTHQTTSSSNHEEADTNNYLDKLVSMYLSKDADKPISHLKNEFHVYTAAEKNGTTQLHPKTLASYRQEQGHYSAHEFFRAASQYESWCNERRVHGFRSSTGTAPESSYPETAYDYHSTEHYPPEGLSDQARYLYGGAGFTSPKSYSRHQFLQNFGATVDK